MTFLGTEGRGHGKSAVAAEVREVFANGLSYSGVQHPCCC